MRTPAACLLVLIACSGALRAQEQAPASPPATTTQQTDPLPEAPGPRPTPQPHRFWDTKNRWLFAGVGASRALDFASTRNMRTRGRDEILLSNKIVDNKPAFVAIEAATTLASVGLSYWFHRTGHHKLERWTSIVHISVTSAGAGRNYLLKSRPRNPTTP